MIMIDHDCVGEMAGARLEMKVMALKINVFAKAGHFS